MAKMHVSSVGHEVSVEDPDMSARALVSIVEKLWRLTTAEPAPGPGSAFGFAHERRWSPHTDTPPIASPKS